MSPSATLTTVTSRMLAAPVSFKSIRFAQGSGFDPLNYAISVVFIHFGPGIKIVVPTYAASADSIEVIVPPFLDQTPGFSSGVMNVQAIQVSESSLMTSNGALRGGGLKGS